MKCNHKSNWKVTTNLTVNFVFSFEQKQVTECVVNIFFALELVQSKTLSESEY